MKKNQMITILLSVMLLTSVTLPGTWANEEPIGDVVNEAESIETSAESETAVDTDADTDTDTDMESESDTETETESDTETETETETEPESETETETEPETDAMVENAQDSALPTEEDLAAANIAFEQIMECVTLDDIWLIMDNMTDAQMDALTLEQYEEIDALIAFLCMPLDDANILIEDEEVIEEENDAPVESVVIYPTVDFVYAAPLGDPVIG